VEFNILLNLVHKSRNKSVLQCQLLELSQAAFSAYSYNTSVQSVTALNGFTCSILHLFIIYLKRLISSLCIVNCM